MLVRTYVNTHVYMHAYTNVHMHVSSTHMSIHTQTIVGAVAHQVRRGTPGSHASKSLVYAHAYTHPYTNACTHPYTHACTHVYTHAYRADWEPAAANGRRVLGVSWGCPAV